MVLIISESLPEWCDSNIDDLRIGVKGRAVFSGLEQDGKLGAGFVAFVLGTGRHDVGFEAD